MSAMRSGWRNCARYWARGAWSQLQTCHAWSMCASRIRRWSNAWSRSILGSGEKLVPQVKYYDYGVISVLLEFSFEAD